jgi:uncharacterized protein YecE (DUF72 family)
VPAGFCFAVKAPQRITHVKRLAGADALTAAFYRAAAELGPALGPVLFQLPPTMKRDLPRLEAFLDALPPGRRAALEFRHGSWLEDDVYAALASRGAALCITDTDEASTPFVATAPFGYLRLRRAAYSAGDLRRWADRIGAQRWQEAYVYFKHEDEAKGPAFALALREITDSVSGVHATRGRTPSPAPPRC